jgi:hypothetical protein
LRPFVLFFLEETFWRTCAFDLVSRLNGFEAYFTISRFYRQSLSDPKNTFSQKYDAGIKIGNAPFFQKTRPS